MISMAEIAAYYDMSQETRATLEELKKTGGYLSTDKRNELKSDDEASQRETLLPNKILRKDGKTTFHKRTIPAPLQFPVIGLENEYNETALLSPWTPREEQINQKSPFIHVTDVWKYQCGDCGLCKKKASEESGAEVGEDGGDDRGDGDNRTLMETTTTPSQTEARL